MSKLFRVTAIVVQTVDEWIRADDINHAYEIAENEIDWGVGGWDTEDISFDAVEAEDE